jgi:hypothetical protein
MLAELGTREVFPRPLLAACESYELRFVTPVVGAMHMQVQRLDVVEELQNPPAFSRDSISSISRSRDTGN